MKKRAVDILCFIWFWIKVWIVWPIKRFLEKCHLYLYHSVGMAKHDMWLMKKFFRTDEIGIVWTKKWRIYLFLRGFTKVYDDFTKTR